MIDDISSSYFPSPQEFNINKKEFRPIQIEAFQRAFESEKRFVALSLPTGAGKSVVAMMLAHTMGRAVTLTSTKGLQNQYRDEFGAGTTISQFRKLLGEEPDYEKDLIDIRGRGNYQCSTPPARNCDIGRLIGCAKSLTCPYQKQKIQATKANKALTNYKYWLYAGAMSLSLLKSSSIAALILDEAHLAPQELADFLSMTIRVTELEVYGDPPRNENIDEWRKFIHKVLSEIPRLQLRGTTNVDAQKDFERIVKIDNLLRSDSTIIELKKNRRHDYVEFHTAWPGIFAEHYLFKNIPKVFFLSATVRPKTLALLGIPKNEIEFIDFPRVFPPNRCPVIFIPTARMSRKSTTEDYEVWYKRIDEIIEKRLDRKGIIHTVSYSRADDIRNNSKFRKYMILNDPAREETAVTIDRFKKMAAPAILVSPSVTTGWDFPDDECRWQIVTKIPYPDSSSKIMKERLKNDPQYLNYLTAQDLVQICGRGMRHNRDRCETFIIDSLFTFFQYQAKGMLPTWFKTMRMRDVPKSPPKD